MVGGWTERRGLQQLLSEREREPGRQATHARSDGAKKIPWSARLGFVMMDGVGVSCSPAAAPGFGVMDGQLGLGRIGWGGVGVF